MNFKHIVSAAAAVAAALAAPAASAAFINGSITASGSVTNLPALPSSSLVTGLVTLSTGGFQGANATGDFTPPISGPVAPYSFTIDQVGATLFTYNGFTFTVNSWGTKVVNPFSCTATQCGDQVAYTDVVGSVDDGPGGFAATGFTNGTFQFSGTCNTSNGSQCTSNASGGWQGVFASSGKAPTLPEPTSLALVGLALAGLGFTARRRAAK